MFNVLKGSQLVGLRDAIGNHKIVRLEGFVILFDCASRNLIIVSEDARAVMS